MSNQYSVLNHVLYLEETTDKGNVDCRMYITYDFIKRKYRIHFTRKSIDHDSKSNDSKYDYYDVEFSKKQSNNLIYYLKEVMGFSKINIVLFAINVDNDLEYDDFLSFKDAHRNCNGEIVGYNGLTTDKRVLKRYLRFLRIRSLRYDL